MLRDMREVVRDVVTEITRQKVRDDELLVSSGIIDSLRVLKLISRLDDQLQIHIPTDQVQPEDFDSVDLILETIERVAIS
jgi:acyl carrier protein